jgi:hypothetical protein
MAPTPKRALPKRSSHVPKRYAAHMPKLRQLAAAAAETAMENRAPHPFKAAVPILRAKLIRVFKKKVGTVLMPPPKRARQFIRTWWVKLLSPKSGDRTSAEDLKPTGREGYMNQSTADRIYEEILSLDAYDRRCAEAIWSTPFWEVWCELLGYTSNKAMWNAFRKLKPELTNSQLVEFRKLLPEDTKEERASMAGLWLKVGTEEGRGRLYRGRLPPAVPTVKLYEMGLEDVAALPLRIPRTKHDLNWSLLDE